MLHEFLARVLAFSDERAEQTHDYVQWLFPMEELSGSVQGAPVLSGLDIDEIKKSAAAQANLIKASEWFFQFLNQNQVTKFHVTVCLLVAL